MDGVPLPGCYRKSLTIVMSRRAFGSLSNLLPRALVKQPPAADFGGSSKYSNENFEDSEVEKGFMRTVKHG